MTKKHYIVIARALREVHLSSLKSHTDTRPFQDLYAAICGVLSRDNPRFDHQRFSAAVFDGTIVERLGCKPRPLT